jgi:hypothetical protein
LVNPTEARWTVSLTVNGAELAGKSRRWILTGPSRWAFNSPGRERTVDIRQTSHDGRVDALDIAPMSVSLYSMAIR